MPTLAMHLKKSLGQVFLRESWPCERIVSHLTSAGITSVLEIGPGSGALTSPLITAGLAVTAVEKDQRWVDELQRTFAETSNFSIINRDIVNFDIGQWLIENDGQRCAVVGNLPYNMSTPILTKILPLFAMATRMESAALKVGVVMTQLEFARRIVGKVNTKDYSSLSVFARHRCIPEMMFKVSRGCFRPIPDVDSAVVSLRPREQVPPDEILAQAERITRTAFQQRRKKASNSLSEYKDHLAQLGIDPDLRADHITPEQYLAIAECSLSS